MGFVRLFHSYCIIFSGEKESLFENFVLFFAHIHKIYISILYNKENTFAEDTTEMAKILRITAMVLVLLAVALPLVGCASCKNGKAVATVGDYEVRYDLVRMATLNFKLDLEEVYGDGDDSNGTIWDDPETAEQYRPILEEKVWGLVRDNYAVLVLCEQYGLGIDVFEGGSVQDLVDLQIKALKDSYDSKKDYKNDLESANMTEDVFRFLYSVDAMKLKLFDVMAEKGEFMTDKQEFYDWLTDGNCAYVQHVLRKVTEGEDADAEYNIAVSIRDGLLSGKYDLAWYINNLNDDMMNVSPYYVFPYAYDDALVDAALALKKPGDVSRVIDCNGDYYVLVRIATTDTTLTNSLDSMLELYQWGVIGQKVTALRDSFSIELTDYGRELDLLAIE